MINLYNRFCFVFNIIFMAGFCDVLVGLQYGDEGKAKVIDLIAGDYDIIARFNGGANAGHTIELEGIGKVALNQVPSGIFYKDKILYIGSGCALNLEKIEIEIDKIKDLDINLEGRLFISEHISVIQPHHIVVDTFNGKKIGTTKNGIGPMYSDRATRMIGDRLVNVKLGDLMSDKENMLEKVEINLKECLKDFSVKDFDVSFAMKSFSKSLEYITPYVQRDTLFLEKQVENGKKILFEGAQSVMLDIVKGTSPYVTSSNTMPSAAYVGGDISVKYHRKTIGVGKAIMSRVGNGPFSSEMGGTRSEEYCMEDGGDKYIKPVEKDLDVLSLLPHDDEFEIGKAIRFLSAEYGTVTSRPRRVGVLDLVLLRYVTKLHGIDELFINKCDLLNVFTQTKLGKIPIVTKYFLDGGEIDYVPAASESYRNVEVEKEYLEGFSEDVSNIRDPKKLPSTLFDFVKYIEDYTGSKMLGIGVGPKRDQYVMM